MCKRANKAGRCKTDKLHVGLTGRGVWNDPTYTSETNFTLVQQRAGRVGRAKGY